MYKHQTNSLPQTFSDDFIKHSQVHSYPTRNAQDYSIYKAKTVFADRAIRTTGPTLWNSLDSKLNIAKLLSTLETNLNQVLLIIMNNFGSFWHDYFVLVCFVFVFMVYFCV